jgi:hypothetical protein
MWTPAVLPVVPRGEGDSDEVQLGVGSPRVWTAWSIASQSVDEVRPEVLKAAASFGLAPVRWFSAWKYEKKSQGGAPGGEEEDRREERG